MVRRSELTWERATLVWQFGNIIEWRSYPMIWGTVQHHLMWLSMKHTAWLVRQLRTRFPWTPPTLFLVSSYFSDTITSLDFYIILFGCLCKHIWVLFSWLVNGKIIVKMRTRFFILFFNYCCFAFFLDG